MGDRSANQTPAIVPRWEWRTFGTHFGAAEDRLSSLAPRDSQESDEIYFLTSGGDRGTIVKVRFDLLDIKVLKDVNPEGLEQWLPVMKAGFPLPASETARVFEAIRQDAPALTRDAYTLDRFIDELATPIGIRAVQVHKRRRRLSVGRCSAELTDVIADGRPTRTIAIESEDARAVIATVRDLGLGAYVNTNYLRGLTAVVDGVLQRYAVIDVGTNSVKFHVGERTAGTWRTVADGAELTRLGEGLETTGEISPEAADRTAIAIAGMVHEARDLGVLAIAAVATAGMRIARNSDEVIAAIRARAGVAIDVISGQEEARLAYLAATRGLGLAEGSLAVFDTGGGSTQFTFGSGERIDDRFSVNVGAVRYTERFRLDGVVQPSLLRSTLTEIAGDLDQLDGRPAPDSLVAMGGAVTNMAAVKHGLEKYDPEVVQGTVLAVAEIDRQIELYRSRDAAARRKIAGLQPKRAEVILSGACIVRTIMEKLDQDSLTVSDRGLRHGLLIERFGSS